MSGIKGSRKVRDPVSRAVSCVQVKRTLRVALRSSNILFGSDSWHLLPTESAGNLGDNLAPWPACLPVKELPYTAAWVIHRGLEGDVGDVVQDQKAKDTEHRPDTEVLTMQFSLDFEFLGISCHRIWNFYRKLKMRKTGRSLLCTVSPTLSPRWSYQHPSSPEDLGQMSKPLSGKPRQLTTAGRDKQAQDMRNSILDKFMLLLYHSVQMQQQQGNKVSRDCNLITFPKSTISN